MIIGVSIAAVVLIAISLPSLFESDAVATAMQSKSVRVDRNEVVVTLIVVKSKQYLRAPKRRQHATD
jgi:hypothetical protein